MHNYFLTENVSNTVVALCWKRNIELLEELVLGVHPGSLLEETELIALIRDKKPTLVNDDTRIRIERDIADKNVVEVRSTRGKYKDSPETGHTGD